MNHYEQRNLEQNNVKNTKQQDSTDGLKKRAGRKYRNTPIIKHLTALDSPMKKRYQSTISCSSSIKAHEGKTTTRYCKRPWCAICNPIRTAVRLNNYKEQLEEVRNEKGLQLTTLTIPNVAGQDIRETFEFFVKVFRQFRNSWQKTYRKAFRGVYNLECTHNYKKYNYHPHIHILHESLETETETYEVIDYETGEVITETKQVNALVKYWLKHCTKALLRGQDTRECTELIEAFKYSNKSVFKVKIDGKKQGFIPVEELDVLYQQIAGMRLFNAFGIKKKNEEKTEEEEMEELEAYEVEKPDGIYLWRDTDWRLQQRDDIVLSGFVPNKKQINIYEKLSKNQYYAAARALYQQKRVWPIPEPQKVNSD